MELPWPSGNLARHPFHGDHRIRTETLSEYWPMKDMSNASKLQSIYVSVTFVTTRMFVLIDGDRSFHFCQPRVFHQEKTYHLY
jgi:hypothetical protein